MGNTIIEMKTGKAIKNSARGGKRPVMEKRDVVIHRDYSALDQSRRGKYLPHMGDKQKAKAAKRKAVA